MKQVEMMQRAVQQGKRSRRHNGFYSERRLLTFTGTLSFRATIFNERSIGLFHRSQGWGCCGSKATMVYRSRDIQYVSVGKDRILAITWFLCVISYHTNHCKSPTNQPGFDHNFVFVKGINLVRISRRGRERRGRIIPPRNLQCLHGGHKLGSRGAAW